MSPSGNQIALNNLVPAREMDCSETLNYFAVRNQMA